MAEKPDGGSAFPWDAGDPRDGSSGMTLRDWFAGKALGELVTQFMAEKSAWLSYDDIATSAYAISDAMIAERKK